MAGLTDDAVARRASALSGGAPLPQADTMTIAKRLLGPLADRYGDVIGARPTTFQDVARDLAIGTMSGDPTKADQLKMKVADSYREQLRKEEDQAFQREDAARQQINGFFELLKQGKTVPKDLRKDFFKETLPQVGVEPTSPLFLKILADHDKFGDVYDALADPALQEAMLNDPLGAVEKMIAAGHDGSMALGIAKQVQQMQRYRAETQGIIARTSRKAASGIVDPADRQRAAFIAKMAGRTVTDKAFRKRVLTADEISEMADKFYPRGAAAGIRQAPAPVTASPSPAPVSETPLADTMAGAMGQALGEPTAPGIAQIPTAAAGQQKVRQITGTVTKVQ